VFNDADIKAYRTFTGPLTMVTFGKQQYVWHANRKQGYADPDGPALTSTIQVTQDAGYSLPPASVTVIRGKLGALSGSR